MRYGFVGLGRLGRYLAGSLVEAGFEVAVHDLDRKAAQPLLDAGAQWASSARAAAEGRDGLITCLPSPKASAAVMTGDSGALEAMKRGATWIEMSTNDLHEIERIAGLAKARGVQTLEAPVTGGVHRAKAGKITVLAGGEAAVFELHRPALEAMGGEVIHVGALGRASVMKVITNMLAFIHLVGAGEALMLAKRGGIDLSTAFRAIRASSGNSFVHETESQVILNGSYDIGFTMDLACKDAGLATAMGREFGVPLELAGLVEQTFIRARAQYGGDAWSPMVVRMLEDALDTDLRAPGFPASLEEEE